MADVAPASAPISSDGVVSTESTSARGAAAAAPAWENDAPLPFVETWSEDQMLPSESKPLTPDEQELLQQLKQAAATELPDANIYESTFVRLVRGYMHEKPAERIPVMLKHLRGTQEWRAKLGADDILQRSIPGEREFARQWPTHFHGVSKRGYVIQVDEVARLDPDFMFTFLDAERLEQLNCKLMERLQALKRQRTRETGVLQYKQIVIIDLNGLGRKHIGGRAQQPIKDQIMTKQSHYPETLYRMYLVNVPGIFRFLWAIIKRFLDPITQKRVVLLGSGDVSSLLEEIDMDQLPESVGGTGCQVQGDCWCKTPWKQRKAQFDAEREEDRRQGIDASS